ncbi:hypothetical protein MSIM_41190 [Mycobacterium simiae]|nr:hypothetical protein MSIM_41190 [Mycobacterium simiae]
MQKLVGAADYAGPRGRRLGADEEGFADDGKRAARRGGGRERKHQGEDDFALQTRHNHSVAK